MSAADETRHGGDPILAALLAWAVPGLGYFYVGRPAKALLLGGSVCVLFLAGMLIGGFGVVSWEHKPVWFFGHAFGGVCTGLAFVLGKPGFAADPTAAHELGVLYTCVAALCNFLLVLDSAGTAVRDHKPHAATDEPRPRRGGVPGGHGMSLALTFVSMLPISALVALVLAGMKRDDPAAIVRAGVSHWLWLVGGLTILGAVIQLITAIVQ